MLSNQTGLILQTMIYLINQQQPSNDVNTGDSLEGVRCYHPFGCYGVGPPWTSLSRPVSLFPESPEKIDPKFCLFTRRNVKDCQILDIGNTRQFTKTNLNISARTLFICHGYIENGNKPWILVLKEELLKNGDYNVVTVDWGHGSEPPYGQAVANSRIMGDVLAFLIKEFVDLGIKLKQIHMIGHSLGSHAISYAGQALQKKYGNKLGRITGMDPAEPHFKNTDPIVRLDPSDAEFVDVIHTDAGGFIRGGLGMVDPVGHLDFYPNGGTDQPGCNEGMMNYITEERGDFFQGIRMFLGCNHIRSYEYFTESVNSPCQFSSLECGSWEEFKNGTCTPCNQNKKDKNSLSTYECAQMGFHSDKYFKTTFYRKNVKLYLKTSFPKPFCRQQYLITLRISNSEESKTHGGEVGLFRISIVGTAGKTNSINFYEKKRYFEPGSLHNSVVVESDIGNLKSAVIEWVYYTTPFNPLTWRFIHVPQIFVEEIRIESIQTRDVLMLCLEEDVALENKKPRMLTRENSKCPTN